MIMNIIEQTEKICKDRLIMVYPFFINRIKSVKIDEKNSFPSIFFKFFPEKIRKLKNFYSGNSNYDLFYPFNYDLF